MTGIKYEGAFLWVTLTSLGYWIYTPVRFDAMIVHCDLHSIAIINEHNHGDFDRNLSMITAELEKYCSRQITMVARLQRSRRNNPGIVRQLVCDTALAELHPVHPLWESWIHAAYDQLDQLGSQFLISKSLLDNKQ